MNAKAKLIGKIGAAAAASAIAMVAAWEGYRPTVYADPIGRSAVCWGHDDPALKRGTTYTRAQCETMLAEDLAKHAEALNCIDATLTDGQKAAFVSFAFNVGSRAFCGSTLVRKANAGDMPGACAELSRWVMAGGKTLPGLVNRRAAERALCETP
jgi:lysozyme